MFTNELIFDLSLQAFYKNEIQELDSTSPFVFDYVLSSDYTSVAAENIVTSNNGSIVTDSAGEAVTTNTAELDRNSTKVHYCTFFSPSFTIALYNNLEFTDWKKADNIGKDADAFMITGYEVLQDPSRMQQAPYILCHLLQTEQTYTDVGGTPVLDNQSSCLMQSQWAFADSQTSNKWGPEQQVYRLLRNYTPIAEPVYDYGFSVITTKNKVRGRGRALSLLFKTEPKKDLKILGWDVKHTEVANV